MVVLSATDPAVVMSGTRRSGEVEEGTEGGESICAFESGIVTGITVCASVEVPVEEHERCAQERRGDDEGRNRSRSQETPKTRRSICRMRVRSKRDAAAEAVARFSPRDSCWHLSKTPPTSLLGAELAHPEESLITELEEADRCASPESRMMAQQVSAS
jgi:hypothetical protein